MTVVGAIVILLYTSRACYNLVVLALSNKSINSFDYDWYNVSDQVNNAGALTSTSQQEMCFKDRFIHPPHLMTSFPNPVNLSHIFIWYESKEGP